MKNNRTGKKPQHERVFDRDEFLGVRCPRTLKQRLEEQARKKIRDMSSLAIEFIAAGLARCETEERQAVAGQLPRT